MQVGEGEHVVIEPDGRGVGVFVRRRLEGGGQG
jgi:hypothetical protein